ncbi:AHS2-domain-containing protein [Pluteus cervinus]|uniref:AHS2-domain-containing protein n=1 Tax=Pluteus cervinus TaxID=181527 RepID=A0ACD3AZJ9_9AGAR|nr:AHS2-domain-containing protein [Pluteus cervinus]
MYETQKLLVANRGEIAIRVLRTARKLGLRSAAIYSPSDALSPHVTAADEAIPLSTHTLQTENPTPPAKGQDSEAHLYLSIERILAICKEHCVTLVHPGYGFLSENAEFADAIVNAGITWVGPRPEIIKTMGLKHAAKKLVLNLGLPLVPGSEGLIAGSRDALDLAKQIGYPVMVKATAGGGGMGLAICDNDVELGSCLLEIQERSSVLFHDDGILLEKYIPSARHIEVQVFGNGLGDVIQMGERECSVQRRHQKIIEETPSPFFASWLGLREIMLGAAVKLCQSICYNSAGTVEFLVDDNTGDFYFLEMNTRIQVEHPVTEVVCPGLDIVELMILQALREQEGSGLTGPEIAQKTYDDMLALGTSEGKGYAIEGRVYAENPAERFTPCPGVLQHVELGQDSHPWLRIDGWVSTGTAITPFFDPLLFKLIVTGASRDEALARFLCAAKQCKVYGPPNNIAFLEDVVKSDAFRAGGATTTFLDGFPYRPQTMKVVVRGIETTIQDLPGRRVGMGIPPSGPMDQLAFRAGNVLIGNLDTTEAIETIIFPGEDCTFQFYVATVLAVTGKRVIVRLNGNLVDMWSRVVVPPDGKLQLEAAPQTAKARGLRTYICIRGGFPSIPSYLGSKSTSMGLGGYQGRSLAVGDHLALGNCHPLPHEIGRSNCIPRELIPNYPTHWVVHVLPGPHDDSEYITTEGIAAFYSTPWVIDTSSNRMGIRLQSKLKITWARNDGGEGGAHPSNILDNGYAYGTININGDTPVIFGTEGPDMGGYLSLATVASAELYKLGQLSPGDTIQFKRISWENAMRLQQHYDEWLLSISPDCGVKRHLEDGFDAGECVSWSILATIKPEEGSSRPLVVLRQAGDSAILADFGSMVLDFDIRVRVQILCTALAQLDHPGIESSNPCIRSVLVRYSPRVLTQSQLVHILLDAAARLPDRLVDLELPGRRITFPVVLDDPWNKEALERYMRTIRDSAVYLPSNIDYLAANNGLRDRDEALQKLVACDWLVFGVGFYMACPFLVPIDPRCRLIGQKMNPSRTYTPRGAIGIAGPVAAIYPVESPGGYQLYGRTLPAWQTWGKGENFSLDKPWFLESFDQIRFEVISQEDYVKIERDFDAGRYSFKVEACTFSMKEYSHLCKVIADDVIQFREKQKEGITHETEREKGLLREWQARQLVKPPPVAGAQGNEPANGAALTSPLSATIRKITCKPGDSVGAGDILFVLEAMKTEVPVRAGEENAGRVIQSLGPGIGPQVMVSSGSVLLFWV